MTQPKGHLYFVCDQEERCRVVVRARSPRHAAMIAFDVFKEENQTPTRNTVTTHVMAEPDGPSGAVLIWAAAAGQFVKNQTIRSFSYAQVRSAADPHPHPTLPARSRSGQ